MSLRLKNKVYHHRRAPMQCRTRSGLVGITRKCTHEWHVKVDMWIDAPGHNKESGRVDLLVSLYVEVLADGLYRLAFNVHICHIVIRGCDNPSILNE